MKKLLIGVSENYADERHDLRTEYTKAIADAGGIPVIIPFNDDDEVVSETVAMCDGVMLSGGCDIDPAYWGEQLESDTCHLNPARDKYDFAIIRSCLAYKIPLLGICRGLQCVNVAFGGSLYQDLPTDLGEEMKLHNQEIPTEQGVHTVSFTLGSRAWQLAGVSEVSTNSHHHQAVRRLGRGLIVSGLVFHSEKLAVVEALEAVDDDVVCFQFHPERMTKSEPVCSDIFKNWLAHVARKMQKQTGVLFNNFNKSEINN